MLPTQQLPCRAWIFPVTIRAGQSPACIIHASCALWCCRPDRHNNPLRRAAAARFTQDLVVARNFEWQVCAHGRDCQVRWYACATCRRARTTLAVTA